MALISFANISETVTVITHLYVVYVVHICPYVNVHVYIYMYVSSEFYI